MTNTYSIREITPADWETIVTHRRRMFEDMHSGTPEQLDRMDSVYKGWLTERLGNGRYRGWFAETSEKTVAAGVGLWLLDWVPGPFDQQSYRGYVLDVYTVPEHRRQGLSKRLVKACMEWCYANDINIVMLHASDQGRPVYESLGFTGTNEMRTWKGRESS